MEPRSVKLKGNWSKIKIVRCLGDPMEVWMVGQRRLSTRIIRLLPGQVMCELDDLVSLADGRSLGYSETKVAGSF